MNPMIVSNGISHINTSNLVVPITIILSFLLDGSSNIYDTYNNGGYKIVDDAYKQYMLMQY